MEAITAATWGWIVWIAVFGLHARETTEREWRMAFAAMVIGDLACATFFI